VNPVRSLLAVLGGIALISLVVEPLEFTLVNATASQPVTDMAGYFAVRNQPGILAAKLVYNTLAALLGGYMAARIAGHAELAHAAFAGAVQTASLLWAAFASEYASFTPGWMWGALIVLTGPAMVAGAAIRARAVRAQAASREGRS
jgi:hypothetical protein